MSSTEEKILDSLKNLVAHLDYLKAALAKDVGKAKAHVKIVKAWWDSNKGIMDRDLTRYFDSILDTPEYIPGPAPTYFDPSIFTSSTTPFVSSTTSSLIPSVIPGEEIKGEGGESEYEEYKKKEDVVVDIDPSKFGIIPNGELKNFTLEENTRHKSYGEIFTVCDLEGKCNYMAKLVGTVPTKYYPTSDSCLDSMEVARREFTIAELMSRIGVGPKIYEMVNTKEGKAIMIMDRYDGTLGDLIGYDEKESRLRIEQFIEKSPQKDRINEYLKQVETLVKIIHEAGVVHQDIRPANIFYRRLPPDGRIQFAIGDYGAAFFSTDERLRKEDLDRVRSDFTYGYPVIFTKGGKKCSGWM